MQTQIPSNNPLQPLRNKFANLTVKQIQLNLENNRCISNFQNQSTNTTVFQPKFNNHHHKHPFKIYQPRRHLAPLTRKQLPAIFKGNSQKNYQPQLNKQLSQNQSFPSQPIINISHSSKRKENSIFNQAKKYSKRSKKQQNHSASSQKYSQRLQSGKSNGRNTFLLNSIIQILKSGDELSQVSGNKQIQNIKSSSKQQSKRIILKTEPSQHYNQFFDVGSAISTKNKRGPKILENDITRIGNHNVIRSRKLYSEQKSRSKNSGYLMNVQSANSISNAYINSNINNQVRKNEIQNKKNKDNLTKMQNIQILTFYNGGFNQKNSKKMKTQTCEEIIKKNNSGYEQNQFVFEF